MATRAKPKPEVAQIDDVTMLVYGRPGTGKTTFAGTAIDDPRAVPVLFIDVEAGTMAIRSKVTSISVAQMTDAKFTPSTDRIDAVRVATWEDFQKLYDLLFDHPEWYRTVVLDSLTEVNYFALTDITDRAAREKGRNPDKAELQDYMESAGRMRRLIRGFRDLPGHTVFIAGVQDKENPKLRRDQLQPALTGKLVYEIPGLVSIVGFLEVELDENDQPIRVLYTAPCDAWIAKDRSEGGRLGGEMEDPTITKIFDALAV